MNGLSIFTLLIALPSICHAEPLVTTAKVKALYSSNVAETGAQMQLIQNQSSTPPGVRPPPPNFSLIPTSVVGDQGLEPSLVFSKNFFQKKDDDDLTLKIEGDTIFYSTQTLYNYESITASLDYSHDKGDWAEEIILTYLDTWYGGVHSQAYWSLKPSLTYDFTDTYSLEGAFDITRATYSTPSWNYTPSLKFLANWTKESDSYITAQYTIAQGNKAGFFAAGPPPPPPTIVAGDLYAYYNTLSFKLGSTFEFEQFTLKGTYELSFTNYLAESLQPQGVPARADTLLNWDLSLAHKLFYEWLSAEGEVTYANNDSTGYNGSNLVNSGVFTNYSYFEWIYSFALEGKF